MNENDYATEHPNTESWMEALISLQLETYRDSATFAQKSTFEPQVTSPASLHLLGYSFKKKKKHCPLHIISTLT